MRLRDLRPRTIEGYLLATRLFIERVDKEPEKLTEDDVRAYFLHLRDDKHQAPSSINIAICALRFFFNYTIERDFEVFNLLRVHRTRVLPVVLSREEVRRLLAVVRHPVRRMLLTTIYALGLRIGEGLHLEMSHNAALDCDVAAFDASTGWMLRPIAPLEHARSRGQGSLRPA